MYFNTFSSFITNIRGIITQLATSGQEMNPQEEVGERRSGRPPIVRFNHQNLEVTVDGDLIDYERQVLTEKGLEINVAQTAQFPKEEGKKVTVDARRAIEFDTKFNENVLCVEIANAIDRYTNSAFYSLKKSSRGMTNTNSNSYCFQICEIMMKKIPLKSRCFETVFTSIPTEKIKLLLENDSFCLEMTKYIYRLNFKFNADQMFKNQEKDQKIYSENVEQPAFINEKGENLQKTKRISKTEKKKRTFQNEKKIIALYEETKSQLKDWKLCYERVNLLLTLFTCENRIHKFLYEMNRRLVAEEVACHLPKILRNQPGVSEDELHQILSKLILTVKTIRFSLGKAEASSQSLKDCLLTNPTLCEWLSRNLKAIGNSCQSSNKLIELMALIAETCPEFVSSLHTAHQITFNLLIQNQVQWIYVTLNTFFPTQEQQAIEWNNATTVLDNLSNLCRIMIKENSPSTNIVRIICKFMCEMATDLRTCDIGMLTFVCCVNSHSRQFILKYLFSQFRRFIRNVKSSLVGSYKNVIAIARKKRHHLLQIMQSIRKISQIESIDIAIDSELIKDIDFILESSRCRANSTVEIEHKKRGDCVRSAYWAMLKNVNVEFPKEAEKVLDESDAQIKLI